MVNILQIIKNVLKNGKICTKTVKKIPIFPETIYTNSINYDIINSQKSKGGKIMKCNVLDIAKYIINKCTNENQPISNLQLQKILHFIQGKWLQENNAPLFDSVIAAWQYGPVVPEVYYVFCGYGAGKILSTYPDLDIPNTVTSIIDPVIEERRNYSPWDLVDETHEPGKAWDTIYQNGEGSHCEIPIQLIQRDFLNN